MFFGSEFVFQMEHENVAHKRNKGIHHPPGFNGLNTIHNEDLHISFVNMRRRCCLLVVFLIVFSMLSFGIFLTMERTTASRHQFW